MDGVIKLYNTAKVRYDLVMRLHNTTYVGASSSLVGRMLFVVQVVV